MLAAYPAKSGQDAANSATPTEVTPTSSSERNTRSSLEFSGKKTPAARPQPTPVAITQTESQLSQRLAFTAPSSAR
jgi:hypothetical protein